MHNGKNTPDQTALIQLIREQIRRRGGLTIDETRIAKEFADEVGLVCRGPERYKNRPFKDWHLHLGPLNHILVKLGKK